MRHAVVTIIKCNQMLEYCTQYVILLNKFTDVYHITQHTSYYNQQPPVLMT